MNEFPGQVVHYLNRMIINERAPFYVKTGLSGEVLEWSENSYGDLGEKLKKGEHVETILPFLTGLVPLPGKEIVLPFIEVENGLFADVHIFEMDKTYWILFLDSTRYESKIRNVLQKRNESRLEMEMAIDYNFFDFLYVMNTAFFVEDKEEVFTLQGKPPSWLDRYQPQLFKVGDKYDVTDLFPFLEVFIGEAENCWKRRIKDKVTSQIWTENFPDGEEFFLQASALILKEKKVLLIEKVASDGKKDFILLQKARRKSLDYDYLAKTEKALRQSQTKLNMILDNIPALLWTTDIRLNIDYKCGSKLGIDKEESEEEKELLINFLNYFSESKLAYTLHEIALSGVPGIFESKFNEADLYCRVEPILNEKGEVEGVIGMGFDISDRKKAEHDKLKLKETETLMRENVAATNQLKTDTLDTICRLTRVAEFRDVETGAHIQRLSLYSIAVAYEMGLNEKQIEAIHYAAPMHDIGKIGIPDHILLKPGKLTPEEWEIMKMHTVYGADMLKGPISGFLKLAEIIALNHHEKWDGSGYPRGLKGNEIPLIAQIVGIADVFDALTSRRPYKKAFSNDESLNVIKESVGKHFSERVVQAFLDCYDVVCEIQEKIRDESQKVSYQAIWRNMRIKKTRT